jgi:LacI family transcriptional regulator
MDHRADCFGRLAAEAGCTSSVLRSSERPGANAGPAQHARIVAWIRSLPKPLGVMTCNDDYGLQLLNSCRMAGIPVPDAVAVIGVGNDACLCNLAVPPLTSIDLAPERIGYEAAVMLERLMSGGSASEESAVSAPQGVVTRRSTDVLALEDHAIVRAVRFIRARACDPIRVRDVLKHVKMSRTALEPRVKAALGRTVHQEILRVQLERVKELLATTDAPIKQVAYRSGFRYPEYMMRVFHRTTGQTPARFRKNARRPPPA